MAPLLGELYGEVLIPSAVRRELLHSGTPEMVRVWIDKPPSWLKEVPVTRRDRSLPEHLGSGESEAISLAMELGLALLLDDQRARKEADLRNVETAGTLAVLVQGAIRGRLDLEVASRRLKALQFRISDEIEAQALARYRRLSQR
jgi:predicted nucleic acid-binding protein